MLPPDEVAFDADVYLLLKGKARELKARPEALAPVEPSPLIPPFEVAPMPSEAPTPGVDKVTLRITGAIPPELWNRLGTKLIPKLRSGSALRLGLELSVEVDASAARALESDLRQALQDLNLSNLVRIEVAE